MLIKKDNPEDLDESSQQSDMHVSLYEPSTGINLFFNNLLFLLICLNEIILTFMCK